MQEQVGALWAQAGPARNLMPLSSPLPSLSAESLTAKLLSSAPSCPYYLLLASVSLISRVRWGAIRKTGGGESSAPTLQLLEQGFLRRSMPACPSYSCSSATFATARPAPVPASANSRPTQQASDGGRGSLVLHAGARSCSGRLEGGLQPRPRMQVWRRLV